MIGPLRAFVVSACLALVPVCAPHAVLAAAPHMALLVELEPATRQISVVAELASPGEFAFELHPSLTVRAASANGRSITASSSSANARRVWRIAAAQGARLRIEYGGTLPELDARLDHRGVLRGLPPMASAQGSFLPSGSGWYPKPPGLFSYSVALSVPSDQRALVAGTLVSETLPSTAAERYTARFEFTQPAAGIDLMAGPYVVREKLVDREGARPLRLRTYFYRELAPLAESYLEDSARYVVLYSREVGAYPFDAFSVVASPLPTGFGMPTLTYLGAQVLKLPFIRTTSLGHEVLHNWWGNGVYADYATGNWSEGLTTFMADYFYKERESAEAAREMRLAWLRDFAAVPQGAHVPLAAFRSRAHGAQAAVGYGKSAMLFLMLRDAIGEDAFRSGIRSFWSTRQFKVAAWDDLRAAFEEASGRSLQTFFEQWVSRAGGPTIEVTHARAEAMGKGARLTFVVTQGKPAYALELPVEVAGPAGTEMHSVRIEGERQSVTLELDHVPERIRIDPDLRLWRVLSRSELPPILRQWIVARAPQLIVASVDAGVGHAADVLARAFLESRPQPLLAGLIPETKDPVLIVGLHAGVDAILQHLGATRPAVVRREGSAQVWTIGATEARPPIAVISARDISALTALVRPLPHYGSQSFLVFDGAKAVARGVWPAAAPVITISAQR